MGSLYLVIFTSSIVCLVNAQIPVYFLESPKISRDFIREGKAIDPNWIGVEVWNEGEPKSLSKFKMTLSVKPEHKLILASKKFLKVSDNTYTQTRISEMVDSWRNGNMKIIVQISNRWQILQPPGINDLYSVGNYADSVTLEYVKRSTVGDDFETTAIPPPQSESVDKANIPYIITSSKWVNKLINKNYYYFQFNLSYIPDSFSYKNNRVTTVKAILTKATGKAHKYLYSTHINNEHNLEVDDANNAKNFTEKRLEESELTSRENVDANNKQEWNGRLDRRADKFFDLLKTFWNTKRKKKSEKKEQKGKGKVKNNDEKEKGNTKEKKRICSDPKWEGTNARCYTYVVVDGCLRCSETAPGKEDMVSKHAMHANAASELFYAGEFCVVQRINSEITLHIDNDSNTYRPHMEDVFKMQHLLQANFPDMPVFTHDTTDEEGWMKQKRKWKKITNTLKTSSKS